MTWRLFRSHQDAFLFSIWRMNLLTSNVHKYIQGTSEPNGSDMSVLARRKIGARVLDLEVYSKTVV